MKRHCDSLCTSFLGAMDLLSRPWNGFILASLAKGPLRFRALADRIGSIGDRMLSLRLKELEANGLLERRVLPGPPVGVEYALTPLGQDFMPVHDAIAAWGARLPTPEIPPDAEERAYE